MAKINILISFTDLLFSFCFLEKTVFTFFSFKDLSTAELLQNLCCYFGYKREKNTWNKFDICDAYIGYNFSHLLFK